MICKKHPSYKGIRRPTSGCSDCEQIYEATHTSGTLSEDEVRVKHSSEVKSLSAQLRIAQNQLEVYQKEHGQISVLIGEVIDAVRAMKPVDPLKYLPQTKVESPCSIVMQLTDQHHGRVQEKSEIEGFGEYNPTISKRFQLQFAKSVLDWAEVKRSAYKFDELVLFYTGDGISGDIHDELRVTNAFPVPVQVVQQAHIMAEQIMILAPHFPYIRLEIIGEDNHGRLTKKPQATQGGLNNWNTVLAGLVKALLAQQTNVQVNWYPSYEHIVHVKGINYLISHGHNLRGWMGIPFYSIERHVGKEAKKRMNTTAATRFHKLVIGHFHAPFDCFWYSIGGSCSGTDALDHKEGREAKPCQTAWLVHPKHGEFDKTNFLLT